MIEKAKLLPMQNPISSIARKALLNEAAAIAAFASDIPESFLLAIDLINSRNGGRVVCTGMRKSGHIATKTCATLVSTGTPSLFLHPGEAVHGDLGMVTSSDLIR